MKMFTKLSSIIFVLCLMILAGCSSEPKPLTESMQGHWKEDDGEDYFISDDEFIYKNADSSIFRFSYVVMMENPDENFIVIKVKTAEGKTLSSRRIQFTNEERKSAEFTIFMDGNNVDMKSEWSYVNDQTEL